MRKKVIFIHGFGVRKDARGMFTDIPNALPDFECILTDLNIVDANGNTHLNPLGTQAQIVREVFEKNVKVEDEIYIIAHSQGCVVAALANLPNIKKVFLLAPPTNNDLERAINNFKKRPGTEIDLEGQSTLMRADGSKTFVPKEYWDERVKINYLEEYKKLSLKNNLIIILASEDEVVDNTAKDELKTLGVLDEVAANHNFEGHGRIELIEKIKKYLS
jgi:esterase/lipase